MYYSKLDQALEAFALLVIRCWLTICRYPLSLKKAEAFMRSYLYTIHL